MTEVWPDYDAYQEKTDRVIPVIEGLLLVALIAGDPGAIDRRSRMLRLISVGLVSVLVLSALWAMALSGIALYESLTVDPWTFIGETRMKLFFTWSDHVLYSAAAFGDTALIFDESRFWTVLLLPILALVACSAAMRMSVPRTISVPAARQKPLIAAMIGL